VKNRNNDNNELKVGKSSKPSIATIEKFSSHVSNQLSNEKNTNFSRLTLFYVTYGCGTNLNKKYSVVQADDMEEARDIVRSQIGPAYAFIYSEDTFAGQVKKYGLEEVPLQAQRSLRSD